MCLMQRKKKTHVASFIAEKNYDNLSFPCFLFPSSITYLSIIIVQLLCISPGTRSRVIHQILPENFEVFEEFAEGVKAHTSVQSMMEPARPNVLDPWWALPLISESWWMISQKKPQKMGCTPWHCQNQRHQLLASRPDRRQHFLKPWPLSSKQQNTNTKNVIKSMQNATDKQEKGGEPKKKTASGPNKQKSKKDLPKCKLFPQCQSAGDDAEKKPKFFCENANFKYRTMNISDFI